MTTKIATYVTYEDINIAKYLHIRISFIEGRHGSSFLNIL